LETRLQITVIRPLVCVISRYGIRAVLLRGFRENGIVKYREM